MESCLNALNLITEVRKCSRCGETARLTIGQLNRHFNNLTGAGGEFIVDLICTEGRHRHTSVAKRIRRKPARFPVIAFYSNLALLLVVSENGVVLTTRQGMMVYACTKTYHLFHGIAFCPSLSSDFVGDDPREGLRAIQVTELIGQIIIF